MSNLFNAFESQIKEFDNEVAKLRAENAELRKLVRAGFFEAWKIEYVSITAEAAWEIWSAQHEILKGREDE